MKFDWKVILFGIISLAIGAYLSYYFQKKSNEELLSQIKKEIESLKQVRSRISETQQSQIEKQINELEGAVNVLEQKLR